MPQAFDTAKSVAAENQPAGVYVMMAIHNNNTEGATTAPRLHIPQLENINHAYERYDNGRGLLFNNQPSRMGECADSSASWLDLSNKL